MTLNGEICGSNLQTVSAETDLCGAPADPMSASVVVGPQVGLINRCQISAAVPMTRSLRTPPQGLIVVLLQASLERRDNVLQQGHVPGPPPDGLSYFCVNLWTIIILIPVLRGNKVQSRRAGERRPNWLTPTQINSWLFHLAVSAGRSFTDALRQISSPRLLYLAQRVSLYLSLLTEIPSAPILWGVCGFASAMHAWPRLWQLEQLGAVSRYKSGGSVYGSTPLPRITEKWRGPEVTTSRMCVLNTPVPSSAMERTPNL